MRTFVVLDLEWNQSPEGKEGTNIQIPFEIVEIGAVKLDENLQVIDEFQCFVEPIVYSHIHHRVYEVIHMGIRELRKRGIPFIEASKSFIDWCYADGDPLFCTWGNIDLTELQRNMHFHGVENHFQCPFLYFDIQKLYKLDIAHKESSQIPLDKAIKDLGIEIKGDFHRALEDAKYTSMVMRHIDFEKWKVYHSIDYYHIPSAREEELYFVFPTYAKYVSKSFASKEEAIADKRVSDLICPHCNRMLKKKIRWFSPNQKNYYAVGICPMHGFIKGKVRMRMKDTRYYVIKTMRPVEGDIVEDIRTRKEEARKKRNKKNRERLKRLRELDGMGYYE